jgi:hypothetical protein
LDKKRPGSVRKPAVVKRMSVLDGFEAIKGLKGQKLPKKGIDIFFLTIH